MKRLLFFIALAAIVEILIMSDALAQSSSNKKHIIKLNVLSPVMGCTEFGYEYLATPKRSIETNIGIIGLGMNKPVDFFQSSDEDVKRDAKGVYGAIAYKMYFSKKNLTRSPSRGFFFKPTLTAGIYTHNRGTATVIGTGSLIGLPTIFYGANSIEKEKVMYGTMEGKLGYQFAMGNRVLLGIDAGIGYGIDNKKKAFSSMKDAKIGDVHYTESMSNFSSIKSIAGLTYSAGLNIGIAF